MLLFESVTLLNVERVAGSCYRRHVEDVGQVVDDKSVSSDVPRLEFVYAVSLGSALRTFCLHCVTFLFTRFKLDL